jgi:hypothetical protein
MCVEKWPLSFIPKFACFYEFRLITDQVRIMNKERNYTNVRNMEKPSLSPMLSEAWMDTSWRVK